MKRFGFLACLMIALLSLSVTPFVKADSISYTITGLSTGAGTTSRAYNINNNGEVVGSVSNGSLCNSGCPVVWDNGVVDFLSLAFAGSPRYGEALGINDKGQIVGWAYNGVADLPAFWNSAATDPDIYTYDTHGDRNRLWNINNQGQPVGYGQEGLNIWPIPGYVGNLYGQFGVTGDVATQAYGINDRGEIVGTSASINSFGPPDHNSIDTCFASVADYQMTCKGAHAFVYSNGAQTDLFPNSGDIASSAFDINNKGAVVGDYAGQGFLLSQGTLTYLGFDTPYAINDRGEVVGNHYLWDAGTLYDLNSLVPANSGWTITDARDINDRGQIVGTGLYQGQNVAFEMTPTRPVPEPSSFLLLATGAAFLLRRKKLHRRLS
jgi:uncharacterized membrane protein